MPFHSSVSPLSDDLTFIRLVVLYRRSLQVRWGTTLVGRKFQISSTKFQINHKFQYPMTKTLTEVVLHLFENPALPMMIYLGTTVKGLFFRNFEFGLLGFV
jgi:hypothetical protein